MKYFYVICPVATDSNFDQKMEILIEVGAEFGLQPFFPLMRRRKFDVSQAMRDIEGAAFVFADLSFERPSCYFELGLAEAARATLFLVAAKGTPIHQLSGSETIAYFEDLRQYRQCVQAVFSMSMSNLQVA